MKNSIIIFSLITILLFGMGCSKSENITPVTNLSIIVHFADHIAYQMYSDMKTEALELEARVQTLKTQPTQANLKAAQEQWLSLRTLWEYSEAFLFGPISDLDLDPSWDDWPVNHRDFDAILLSNDNISKDYVANLSTSSKGFHALEYILFGINKSKIADSLKSRELDFAVALSQNITTTATTNIEAWEGSQGFLNTLKTPSATNTTYKNNKSALLEITHALIGICEETGETKINSVFTAQNPSLEESQFSQNSMNDFKANIAGVEMVYLGTYKKAGASLSSLVQLHNKSLDIKIKSAITEAKLSLNQVTDPFGVALTTQPNAINNAVVRIHTLANLLETELLPLLQLKIND